MCSQWLVRQALVLKRKTLTVSIDDALSNFFPGRPIAASILDEECTKVLRTWLDTCKVEHSLCPNQSDCLLPTRVLDVGSSAREPRLVISENLLGQWASLSHCWGGKMALKTETRTIKSHCQGISMDTIPPTFRDAIFITRNLGLKYLWIDALCIIQDSHEDWVIEAAKMDYIYEHATVTIAAEASPDSLTGIVGSTEAHRHDQSTLPKARCHSNASNIFGTIQFRIDRESRIQRRSRSVLSDRAWTLQEEILSPCILRFSAQQVVWRCPTSKLTEWQPQGGQKTHLTGKPDFARPLYDRLLTKPSSLLGPSVLSLDYNGDRTSLFSYWYTEVANQYMDRNITFERDRLIALSGVANKISEISKSQYIAGLWAEDLHSGLAWLTPKANATKYNSYIAPSWSWAQIDCAGTRDLQHEPLYVDRLVLSMAPLAQITKIYTQVVNGSGGEVERWTLELRGQYCFMCSCKVPIPFLDIRPLTSIEYQYGVLIVSYGGSDVLGNISLKMLSASLCLAPRGVDHQTYVYLQLGLWEQPPHSLMRSVIVALVLRLLGNTGLYERVGRAIIPMDVGQKREWPTRTFTII
jgi:hypothetical protein